MTNYTNISDEDYRKEIVGFFSYLKTKVNALGLELRDHIKLEAEIVSSKKMLKVRNLRIPGKLGIRISLGENSEPYIFEGRQFKFSEAKEYILVKDKADKHFWIEDSTQNKNSWTNESLLEHWISKLV